MVSLVAEVAPALVLLCGVCYLAFYATWTPEAPVVGEIDADTTRDDCCDVVQIAVNVELFHSQHVLLRYETRSGRCRRLWVAVQSLQAIVRSGPRAIGEEADALKGLRGHIAIKALGVPCLVGVAVLIAKIGIGLLWGVEVPGAFAATLVVIASSGGMTGMPLLQLLGAVRICWTRESLSCCFVWRRSPDTFASDSTTLSFGRMNAWGFQRVSVQASDGRKRTIRVNGVQASELAEVFGAQH
jgi:hypothetical protein